MSYFIQMEVRRSTATTQQLHARESARLALLMAIGQLQQSAGPDTRVSARGELVGLNQPRYWTGIWDSAHPSAEPTWLVSWQNQPAPPPQSKTLRIVAAGLAGSDPTGYVEVPILEIPTTAHSGRTEIAWWTSDEGVKAAASAGPTQDSIPTNYTHSAAQTNWQIQLSSQPALEEILLDYDRAQSESAAQVDRYWSYSQLLTLPELKDPARRNTAGEPLFHALTPFSYGVLASTVPDSTHGGLQRDLSLFPQLLGDSFKTIIESSVATARAIEAQSDAVAARQHFADFNGLDAIAPLADGAIANPITPILSNLLLAFTLRSESPYSSHPNFFLRMRFFCELWNPYTSSFSMESINGDPLQLELEINGLPTITAIKTTGIETSSPPIDLQTLLKDPTNSNGALVIRLQNDPQHRWLPGQSKNWTGVDASTATGPSPYDSILTDQKSWDASAHNLGGSMGLDTGIPRLSGDIRHISNSPQQLQVRLYSVEPSSGTRSQLLEWNDVHYEPISTRLSGYSSNHSGSTFGYQILLRGPEMSRLDPLYYGGRWLYDHDPRNPQPYFPQNWHLDNAPAADTGSAYVPVKNGISPLPLPLPSEINETNSTLNTVVFRRLLDRSHGGDPSGSTFNRIWQDAPLFELMRERPLAIADLQHLYFHNERPFQVGNSWGARGKINTLAWFDRYYFSGLARSDPPDEYDPQQAFPNPLLRLYALEDPAEQLQQLHNASADDHAAASALAANLLNCNRFNINSTSITGWKAALGGLYLNEWTSLQYPADSSNYEKIVTQNTTQPRTFSRFNSSLAETFDAPASPATIDSEPVAPSAYYRRGARHFDPAGIEALAREVVRRIQLRAAPFFSMEEFLSAPEGESASLLEQAIATVFAASGRQQWDHSWETLGVRSPTSQQLDIDHFSPGFLTQADLMATIGPRLAPRSDTFKIRAYARCTGPQQSHSNTACIEAVLQRTPTPIEGYTSNTAGVVRHFEIIALRWLNPQEL